MVCKRNHKCHNLALLVVLAITIAAVNAFEHIKNLSNVLRTCEKFEFHSITKFQEFVADLRLVDVDRISSVGDEAGKLRKCLEDREAFFELEELIKGFDRERACKFSEVTKLEEFAKKYLVGLNRRPFASKFFTLFGVNLAFVCQLNLLAHMRQADLKAEQLDFIYSIASPTGWNVLINEHTKKSMKFGTSGRANNIVNRVAKLVPGLTNVAQLNYLDFHHRLEANEISNWKGVERGSYSIRSSDLAQKVHQAIERILDSCKNLDQFYFNSILSLAKLNHLGLLVNFDVLNQYQENNVSLHKWLAAASFCQLLVRVRSDLKSNTISFEILHDDSLIESRRRLYSYVARIEDEFHPKALELAWTVGLSDGNWNYAKSAIFRADFKDGFESVAAEQVGQFIRGLERDYKLSLEREL